MEPETHKIIAIAAMSLNGVIGSQGRLPWHVPVEYAHFLNSINNQVMVMGRKSWEVFGADVNTACNIVLSRTPAVMDRAVCVQSLKQALDLGKTYRRTIFIAGGGEIYKAALQQNCCHEMWLSTIPMHVEGEVQFPEFNPEAWTMSEEQRCGYIFRRWQNKSLLA
jgi:dihydrofolate reductase